MSDDEINRRVAEIEGWKYQTYSPDWSLWWCKSVEDGNGWYTRPEAPDRWLCAACYGEYPVPYATDWAWCGPLLKRDIILLKWDTAKPSRKWMAMTKHGVLVIGNDTPQRAICLAVIAAHKPAILQGHETPPPGPGCPPARPDVAD